MKTNAKLIPIFLRYFFPHHTHTYTHTQQHHFPVKLHEDIQLLEPSSRRKPHHPSTTSEVFNSRIGLLPSRSFLAARFPLNVRESSIRNLSATIMTCHVASLEKRLDKQRGKKDVLEAVLRLPRQVQCLLKEVTQTGLSRRQSDMEVKCWRNST